MLQTSHIDWHDPVNSNCPLNDGLVAWYLAGPAQGRSTTWRDLCGRNHGTLVADMLPATAWSPAGGRPGGFGALEFDGTEDYVTLGSHANTAIPAPITITAWIYLALAHTQYHGIVVRTDQYNEANSKFAFYLGNQFVDSNDRKLQFIMGGGAKISDRVVTPFQWSFVAISATTTKTIFMLDGTIDDTRGGVGGNPSYGSEPATISGWYTSGGIQQPFQGRIDDVRIFNRALSESELLQIYHESRLGHPDTLRRLTRRYFLVPEYITPTTPQLVTAGSLGLIRMDHAGGTTRSVGIQNGGLLQRYFDGGFREQRLPLMIETGGWGIAGTIGAEKCTGAICPNYSVSSVSSCSRRTNRRKRREQSGGRTIFAVAA